jgi:hypothetical protein
MLRNNGNDLVTGFLCTQRDDRWWAIFSKHSFATIWGRCVFSVVRTEGYLKDIWGDTGSSR